MTGVVVKGLRAAIIGRHPRGLIVLVLVLKWLKRTSTGVLTPRASHASRVLLGVVLAVPAVVKLKIFSQRTDAVATTHTHSVRDVMMCV